MQVRVKALALAEMQAFLQKRRNEDKTAQQEIKNLTDELERYDCGFDIINNYNRIHTTFVFFPTPIKYCRHPLMSATLKFISLRKYDHPMIFVPFPSSLHKEKHRFLMDIMIQVLLKQGQVEMPTTDFTPDFSDCVLLDRSVVEDLNSSIRVSLYNQTHTNSYGNTYTLEKSPEFMKREYLIINYNVNTVKDHFCSAKVTKSVTFKYVKHTENGKMCKVIICVIRHLETKR